MEAKVVSGNQHRVAIVYRGEIDERSTARLENSRFAATAAALEAAGLEVEAAPYADEAVEDVRAQLLQVDAVLVWVNPVERGHDRSTLDAMLRNVASKGVVVSAHPEVIDTMGTKEVLYRTRTMGWGSDTRLYATSEALRRQLPASLALGPRVLKQLRGQSGDGVWKVELADTARSRTSVVSPETALRVRHAKPGSVEVTTSFETFLAQCRHYFRGNGGMIDQAYQSRLPEGMVRCYLVGDRVAGFGEQIVNMLYPAAPRASPSEAPQPGPRLYFPPTRPDFQSLKEQLERNWLSELCSILELERTRLPVIWDADFLYGPKDADGRDTYVLCEINVSSVYPFPEQALAPLAEETLARLIRSR